MLRTLSRRLTWPGMLLVAAVLVGTAPGGAADAASQARATAVSTGGGHACALLSDQTVRCWGNNDHGQLGTGTRTRHLTAVAVRGLTDVTAISVGSVSCALIAGGGAKCWGPNHDGELGDGTTTDRLTPVAVSGLTDAIAISAGGQHACALLADHTMRCWGVNADGELGNGTRTPSLTPVAVPGLSNVIAISAGSQHTCALLAGGTATCWGWSGLMGPMYKATDALTPVAVPGLSGAVTISADPYDSCALLSAGIVDCWGLDAGLESGVPQPAAGDTSTPIAVRGLVRVKAFAHSFDGQQGIHSCAVLASGTVKCTSTNPYAGQLGNGTLSSKATKTPATVTGLRDAIAISASDFYTCALRSGGSVVCWGDNHYGQLGDGTTITRSRPVTVQGFGQPVTPAGGGSKAVPVLGDALFGEVGFGHARPAQIGTSGVIAGYIAGDVHWSHWGAARTTGTGIGLWLPPGATTESDKQRTPVKVVAYDLGVCKGKRAYLQMDVYFPRHGGRFRPGPHDGICH